MNPRVILSSDGLPRRTFTVADVDRMVEVGLIGPDERLEIVGGEIIPMSPKGNRHEVLKIGITLHFGAHRPPGVLFAQEPGWRVDEATYLEPDFLFFREAMAFEAVTGKDALLVIEIADSSLGYDLGRKAALYAELGVPELWVIDAARRETHVHLSPAVGGYAAVRAYPPETLLQAALNPGIRLVVSDLKPGR